MMMMMMIWSMGTMANPYLLMRDTDTTTPPPSLQKCQTRMISLALTCSTRPPQLWILSAMLSCKVGESSSAKGGWLAFSLGRWLGSLEVYVITKPPLGEGFLLSIRPVHVLRKRSPSANWDLRRDDTKERVHDLLIFVDKGHPQSLCAIKSSLKDWTLLAHKQCKISPRTRSKRRPTEPHLKIPNKWTTLPEVMGSDTMSNLRLDSKNKNRLSRMFSHFEGWLNL